MTELTRENKEEKINREDKKLRAQQDKFMIRFIRDKTIPVLVGNPESLNEREGYYQAKFLRFLGFALLRNRDSVFTCIFPKGWKKISMKGKNEWCYLIDNKGQRRAAIFYKVLGIVRDGRGRRGKSFTTFINYMTRFRAMADHVVAYDFVDRNTDKHYNSPIVGRILDGNDFIYETEPIKMIYKYGDELYYQEEKEIRSKQQAVCQELVDEYLDNADNVFMYWKENDETKLRVILFRSKLKELIDERKKNLQ